MENNYMLWRNINKRKEKVWQRSLLGQEMEEKEAKTEVSSVS